MSYRKKFFKKRLEVVKLSDLAQAIECSLVKESDGNLRVSDIATLDEAGEGDLSFLTSKKYISSFLESKAQFCIVDEKVAQQYDDKNSVLLVSKNPHYSYSLALKEFYEDVNSDFSFSGNCHPEAQVAQDVNIANNAYIGKNVTIGKGSVVSPMAVIMDNVEIGANCIIGANCVISHSIIGNNCIIHAGAKIGQDGFGFAHNNGVNHKVMQIGIVEIADEVEIGANTAIDRGAIKNTKIGKGTKIDNLVQIAHNVEIGSGCFIAACAGIAGSTKIGNYVQIGGNAGISGHIEIGDFAQISGMSGVTKSIDKSVVVGGYPARPIKEWLRMDVKLSKMIK